MGPDAGAAPCSEDKPLESRMPRRRLTSSSYLLRCSGGGEVISGGETRLSDEMLSRNRVEMHDGETYCWMIWAWRFSSS